LHFRSCIDTVHCEVKLYIKKVIKCSIYGEGRAIIYSALNKGVHEILDLVLLIILTIFFCNWLICYL